MKTIPPALRQYVDETGLLLEAAGLPRIAGQVLGWMQVCEPEHQSLTDLTDALGISKASASTTTRLLVHVGFLERAVLPNDRRDYYRISQNAWKRFLHTRFELMHQLRRNADHGLRILDKEPPRRRDRLVRMRRLYAFLERELPRLLARFEAQESNNRRDRPAKIVANSLA
jgi:DNA-binding transcriptional regulator GbsR (MarR family)